MRYILFLTLPLLLWAKTTFITQEEYAARLYKNPRGIGCQNCHGEKGEGKTVAKYIHKNVEKSFSGPVINKLDYAAFYKALNTRIDSMPRYFLTPKEVSALYFYLNEEELQKAKNAQKEKEDKEIKEAKAKTKTQESKVVTQTKEVNVTNKVKDVSAVAQTKEAVKTTEVKDVNAMKEIKEIKEEIESKEETEVPESKEEIEMTEVKDIREMFKEATEAKNAKQTP